MHQAGTLRYPAVARVPLDTRLQDAYQLYVAVLGKIVDRLDYSRYRICSSRMIQTLPLHPLYLVLVSAPSPDRIGGLYNVPGISGTQDGSQVRRFEMRRKEAPFSLLFFPFPPLFL